MAKDKDIIIEFVKHINNHNLEEIAKLLSDDHIFIDAYGQNITGKEEMKKAWQVYFEWFPNYAIIASEIIIGKQCAAMLGYASGTYKGYKNEANSFYWRLPAAWKIIVENDTIKHWQVYCDTKVPSQIIERDIQPKPPPQTSQFYK